MTDRGMKQRTLQTQVTKWSLFFLILILMNKVDQRAEPAPQPRTLEGLLPGGHTARDPRCAAASRWSGRKCPRHGHRGVV